VNEWVNRWAWGAQHLHDSTCSSGWCVRAGSSACMPGQGHTSTQHKPSTAQREGLRNVVATLLSDSKGNAPATASADGSCCHHKPTSTHNSPLMQHPRSSCQPGSALPVRRCLPGLLPAAHRTSEAASHRAPGAASCRCCCWQPTGDECTAESRGSSM
jgi:hypothetical protein